MLRYLEGTVFNSPAKTLVNTVNCSGVMGAGIALEFKLRFPEMYEDYVEKCRSKYMKIGVPRIFKYTDNLWIMNFPTKLHWRYPSKLEWIEEGLKYFVNNYEKVNIESIAFPKLGTNNGGLDWNIVKQLMEQYLKDIKIPVYICLDELNEAEGIEKIMVDELNNSTMEELVKGVKLSKKQAEELINNLPISRFFHILKKDGFGKKSYEKIFSYYYSQANQMKNSKDVVLKPNANFEQLSFF